MDWLKRMNSVLDYIEDNLDGEIKDDKIVMLSLSSKGVFQKIFTMITDMTLSEYIRKRKLTQAAIDIQKTDMKIIDIAVKYGYNSADAFSAAFKSFHGITPSDVKKSNIQPQSFQRLIFTLNLSVKGGNDDMQYRNINLESVKDYLGALDGSMVISDAIHYMTQAVVEAAGMANRIMKEVQNITTTEENKESVKYVLELAQQHAQKMLMMKSSLYVTNVTVRETALMLQHINKAIQET